MKWTESSKKPPKQGQWVVIVWAGNFKCGQFDNLHPFGPACIDRSTGKYFNGFTHWAPLSFPKAPAL